MRPSPFSRTFEINPQLLGAQLISQSHILSVAAFPQAEAPLRRTLSIDPANKQAGGLLVFMLREHTLK